LNRTTRVTTSILGFYAGSLGIEHGVFEVLQGNVAPSGLMMVNAIGPPCQPENVWHACYPALTLVPNYVATGIAASIASLAVLIWATTSVQRKAGGPVLSLLSVAMLLVGGGFVPAFAGIVAGVAGTGIGAPLARWRARGARGGMRFLAGLWPWPLVVLLAWLPGGWILGHFSNQILMDLSLALFLVLDVGLPLLAVFAGLARDSLRTPAPPVTEPKDRSDTL
jgi:hypothetical protein